CHLFESDQGKLLGLNTEFSLNKVLDLIELEQPCVDIYLATGDLSQDGSAESYRRFHRHMERFSQPVYWLPGNHDVIKTMTVEQAAERCCPLVVELQDWRIILLDSTVPGKVPGNFAETQLEFLQQALEQTKGYHVMVCMHHQPVKVGCPWLDDQLIGNADDLFAILDNVDHVRALIWGHVHQVYEGERNGVKLFSVPSTCVQFKPDSEDFAVDDTAPGYRWIDLHANGQVETSVSRVEEVKFEIDYTIKGY
ncbi:MAG: 3',5'-cyclic-AMP phosphodiesterase, partial [Moraxellaceae bacterium]